MSTIEAKHDMSHLPCVDLSRFNLEQRLSKEILNGLSSETLFAMRTVLTIGQSIRAVDVRKGVAVKSEGVLNLVSEWDRLSSEVVRRELKTHYPNDPLLSEEIEPKPSDPLKNPRLWVVDELDGTFNASRGINYYAIAIGFVKDGRPASGAVYFPPADQLIYGEIGVGTFLDETRVRVRDHGELAKASITTNASYQIETLHKHLALLVATRSPRVTVCGSTVMSLVEVALGRHELGFALDSKPWDRAAAEAIVIAAGGVVKGIDGRETTILDPDIVVGNEPLVYEFIKLSKPHKK